MSRPENGSLWRRRKDGKCYEVVHVSRGYGGTSLGSYVPPMVQLRREGATNLKSTNWLELGNFDLLYEAKS